MKSHCLSQSLQCLCVGDSVWSRHASHSLPRQWLLSLSLSLLSLLASCSIFRRWAKEQLEEELSRLFAFAFFYDLAAVYIVARRAWGGTINTQCLSYHKAIPTLLNNSSLVSRRDLRKAVRGDEADHAASLCCITRSVPTMCDLLSRD